MLNNLTNFFNLIAGKRVKTTANPDDLITLGVRDPRTPGIYQPAAIKVSDLVSTSGVTSVTGTAPVVSSGGSTPAISMPAATTLVSGHLTSTDFNTFNNKQAALVSGTNIKTINGSSVLGSGDLVVGGASNPSVIALSAVNGTTVNGLGGDTISQTLTIPANTFTGNGLLEVRFRISKSFATGSNYFIRVYVNTANTLSGATLMSQGQVSPVQIFQQITRTMLINSNTLTAYSGGLQYDFQTNTSAPYSATFNINQQQFLIFTMQLANAGETGFVEFASAVKYI